MLRSLPSLFGELDEDLTNRLPMHGQLVVCGHTFLVVDLSKMNSNL